MALYLQEKETDSQWPQPIEGMYQLLGGGEASALAPKLPHLGLADILFMTAVMCLPKERRPWGIATWMADVFLLSRPALYALTERTRERLLLPAVQAVGSLPDRERGKQIIVSPERVARTVLTAAFPGKMALRPIQQMLAEALDDSHSIGWLSELMTEAGQRAGAVLAEIDTSPLGTVIAARDETFFNEQPLLLVIDPVSTVILQAVVTPDRQAETWGAVLLMTQDRGVTLGGLVEDMARMYPASQQEAGLNVDVQKDIWHIQRDGVQRQTDLERDAIQATRQVIHLEEKLLKQWDSAFFEQKYIPAVAKEEGLYAQHAAFTTWFGHLCDALEVVDMRSGEIRDRTINGWLLEQCLTALEQIDHERVASWVRSLRRCQTELLTYLDWLDAALTAYRQELAQSLPIDQAQTQFLRSVARVWRLQQALVSGHNHLRNATQQAQQALQLALAECPILTQLAQRLMTLLDGACRTSSLIENVNGLLKQFLHNRRSFASAETLQTYLNLFTLWHNMRIYQRGKRRDTSPYQMAGIHTASDDWLELLGYPAA
ncbi:MAG: hypothetical protein KF893_04490 [Caldilineaceae bacterium]|nr:hypothetical protein [Caldilineaceae bacterium]